MLQIHFPPVEGLYTYLSITTTFFILKILILFCSCFVHDYQPNQPLQFLEISAKSLPGDTG